MKTVNTVETIQQPMVGVPNTNTPNFKEISKWSLHRKRVLSDNIELWNENRKLKKEVLSLSKDIKSLELRYKLITTDTPSSFYVSKSFDFDVQLTNTSDDSYTFHVMNDSLEYEENVEVDIDEMLSELGEDFTSKDVEDYIMDCIKDSLYF
jgi:hypothetical protein